MKNSKLGQILSSLSVKEIRKFKEFTLSPYFNKNTLLCDFLDVIIEYHPDLDNPALEKENIYAVLFPGEPFSDQKVRDLMSYLSRLAEEFLGVQALEQHKTQQTFKLLEEYKERGLSKLFKKTEAELRKSIYKQEASRDSSLYYYRFLLEKEVYQQALLTEESLDTDMSLQRMLDNLDRYYLYVKLKYSGDLISQNYLYAKEFNLKMIPNILAYLQDNIQEYDQNPSILLYQNVLLMFSHEQDVEHYNHFLQLLEQYEHTFSKKEVRLFYAAAQNYCAFKISYGQSEYFKEVFLLYQKQLKNGILFNEKVFPTNAYNNIVNSSLLLGELDWCGQFIEDYKDKLPRKHKESCYTFNLAKLLYKKGELSAVLPLLQQVEFTDITYNLGAKTLLARTYYEMNELEPLASLLNAFSMYLKRNKKVSTSRHTTHSNFVSYVRKLTNLKTNAIAQSKAEVTLHAQDLFDQLEQQHDIVNKEWLMGKVKEFIS